MFDCWSIASISLIRCLRSVLVLLFIRSHTICMGFIAGSLAVDTLKVAQFADSLYAIKLRKSRLPDTNCTNSHESKLVSCASPWLVGHPRLKILRNERG